MAKLLFGRIWPPLALIDGVLGVWERIWAWAPPWLRRLVTGGAVWFTAWVVGVTAAVVVWVGQFATDYGALAVLSILAGAGAATQFRGLADKIISSMDRLAASRPPKELPPPPLSDGEKVLIQHLRRVWKRYGEQATGEALELFQEAKNDIAEVHYWSGLLHPHADALRAAVAKMDTAVAAKSTAPLEEVRATFNEMYGCYLTAIKWIARLQAHGDFPLGEHEGFLRRKLEHWKDDHYVFHDKLMDLAEIPEYSGKLKVFVQTMDPSLANMIHSAQVKPSKPDTEALPNPESAPEDPET